MVRRSSPRSIPLARVGLALEKLAAKITTELNRSKLLGVSDRPPIGLIVWELAVEADAPAALLEVLRVRADNRCPAAFCTRNPIAVSSHLAGESR